MLVHSHENTWHGHVHTFHVRPVRYALLQTTLGSCFQRKGRFLKTITSPRLLSYLFLEACRVRAGKQVIAVSPTVAEELKQAYPQLSSSKGSLSLLPPGVDIPTVLPSKAQARKLLALPESAQNAHLLLFVANDYRKKGLSALLLALAQLPPKVQVLVVGGQTKQRLQYESMVQRLGLEKAEKRVYFLGQLDKMAPAYAAADMLVHPTQEDSFAMVVLEALAHRLPVIVSGYPYCGLSQSLQDGQEALLLEDPLNSTLLAEKIQYLSQSPLLQKSLCEKGLALAQQYDWQKIAQHQEAIYYQLYRKYCLREKIL
jgi:glycosyltransferase involved in cell wall biosynthesis